MKQDPAIQRIRKARHEISAKCGHNTRTLVLPPEQRDITPGEPCRIQVDQP